MRFAKYILFLFPTIFLSSCQKDDVGDKIDLIELSVFEKLGPENTSLFLQCSGGRFECDNVRIDFSLQRTEKAFYLDFGKSYIPSGNGCTQSSHDNIYLADASINIDQILDGNYRFEMSNNDKVIHGWLKIDEKKIDFIDCNSEAVKFDHSLTTLHRIPKDAVWGYASNNHADLSSMLDSLYALGAEDYLPMLEDGHYTPFSIINRSLNYTYDSDNFLLKSTLDTAILRSVMSSFNIDTYVYTGKGDYLYIH